MCVCVGVWVCLARYDQPLGGCVCVRVCLARYDQQLGGCVCVCVCEGVSG